MIQQNNTITKHLTMPNDLIEQTAVHIYYKFSRIIANEAIIKQCCFVHLDLLISTANSIYEIENYNQIKEKIKAL